MPTWLCGDETGLNEWVYKEKDIWHNQQRCHFSDLPSLNTLTPGQSVGLLVTSSGQLHLFVDGVHNRVMATGLPVDTPLWGVASLYGRCTKIRSEKLSGESSGIVISPS